jgi:uncharacterized spore protein YtfJ
MNLENVAAVLLDKLKNIAQTDTVVGKPIVVEGATLVPVSRVSLGFGLGGAGSKADMGGSGGGLSVEPIAFIVVQGQETKIVSLSKDKNLVSKVVDLVPDVLALIRKDKDKDKEKKSD